MDDPPRSSSTVPATRTSHAGLDEVPPLGGLRAGDPRSFLFRVVETVSRNFDVDCVLVGERCGDARERIRTIAVFKDGEPAANFTYDLAGTPCERVVGAGPCLFPRDVGRLFPEDAWLEGFEGYAGLPVRDDAGRPLGLVVGLTRTPLEAPTSDACLRFVEELLPRVRAGLESRRDVLVPTPPTPDTLLDRAGKVLLVDDEELVRRAACGILELIGLEVLTAEDGPRALERLRDAGEEVGLVLLDLTMPRMDGLEVLERLRRLRADLPVVLMSGYPWDDAQAGRLGNGGPSGFLQKPFTVDDVRDALRAALAE